MENAPSNNEASSGTSALDDGLGARLFPVLRAPAGCAAFVRWDALDDRHAQRVHGQSLADLADRGGLSASEIVINVRRLKWTDPVDLTEAIAVTNSIAPNVKVTGSALPNQTKDEANEY